jgi:hypothetical protein
MIVCTGCGAQNPAGATFCGDCGAFLEWTGETEEIEETARNAEPEPARPVAVPAAVRPAEAQPRRSRRRVPPPVPPPAVPQRAAPARTREGWWRRLRRRRKAGYAAGTRRRLRRPLRVLKWLVAVIVVAAVGLVATGPGRDLIDRAQQAVSDRLSDPAPITPAGWEASSAAPDNGPERLSDRVTNEFWAPDGDPVGAWVEAELPRPVRLLHLVVTPGVSTDPALFQEQGRPHELTVTATTEDGGTITTALVVRDQPGPQQFPVEADGVVRVRLEVVSAHGMEPDRFMAIGEVALFIQP